MTISSSKIESAVTAHQTVFLKSKGVDEKGYLTSPEENLIDLSPNSPTWEQIKGEIGKGAGNELADSDRGPAKFRAVQSSEQSSNKVAEFVFLKTGFFVILPLSPLVSWKNHAT